MKLWVASRNRLATSFSSPGVGGNFGQQVRLEDQRRLHRSRLVEPRLLMMGA
jgi:hypothetical protein